MPDRQIRIAQLGTFDVANYGDLLFPLLAQRRMRLAFPLLHMDFVSPAGSTPVWSDSAPALPWQDFVDGIASYDAILIGGGNIVRLNPTDLETYAEGLTPLLAYARLWAAFAEYNLTSVPVLWNAPGVPMPIPQDLVPHLRQAMVDVAYLAVRDEESRVNIAPIAVGVAPVVVPDPAWDLPSLWSTDDLAAAWTDLWARHERQAPARSVVFHLNHRYLGKETPRSIAAQIDRFVHDRNATALLVAIGPCHGDDALAREVGGILKSPALILDSPQSLLEVAATIAGSDLYLGSSMHGFVTATAFGVPAVIVGAASMTKFDGLLTGLGIPELRQTTWAEAFDFAERAAWPDLMVRSAHGLAAIAPRLDAHWDRIGIEINLRLGTLSARVPTQAPGLTEAILGHVALDLMGLRQRDRARINQLAAAQAAQQTRGEERLAALSKRMDATFARARVLEGTLAKQQKDAERERKQSLAAAAKAKKRALAAADRERSLKKSLRDAKAKATAFETSTSWRITSPLRRLLRLKNRLLSKRRTGRVAGLSSKATMPLVSDPVAPQPATPNWQPLPQAAHEVTIVIAVWNAVEDVRRCLASVRHHAMSGQHVLVIDDASPDPMIASLLADYAHEPGWTIVTNPQNLGYTRCVNKGMSEAGSRDVILLNSDTIVTPNWVQRLRHTAYAEPRRGSVTPVSNAAGAFSVPIAGQINELPDGVALDDYARTLSRTLTRAIVDTPTGNGFCLYLKRSMLHEAGQFDEVAFPRGYGEENDFCMRAGVLGWTHTIDFGTYIWHRRSASFGEAKVALMAEGRRVVDARYPSYTKAVAALLTNDEARQHRSAIAAMTLPEKTRQRVLFVISTTTGGTPQTNFDLMKAIDDRIDGFLLRCDRHRIELSQLIEGELVLQETIPLSNPIEARTHRSDEYDHIVSTILHNHGIEFVHIRHLCWHGLGLVDVTKSYGLSILLSFHDFYSVCPTVKLLDENMTFCGGACTSGPGPCRASLWPADALSDLKHDFVYEWRAAMSRAIERCDGFVTTSPGTRDVIVQNFPWIAQRPFDIVPHGRDIDTKSFDLSDLLSAPQAGEPLRVLVLGNIDAAKGNLIYREIAAQNLHQEIEFHILGKWQGDRIVAPNFFFYGVYDRQDLALRVAEIRPHCGMILSVWPETYCHTLTECWSFGLPVFAFDTGAVGERLTASGGGWLIKIFDADSVLTHVRAAHNNPEDWAARLADLKRWADDPEQNPSTHDMGHRYLEIYARHISFERDAPIIMQDGTAR